MNNSNFPTEYSSLAEQSGIPEHVLEFLNSLPVTGEIVEWIEQFREALRLFLGDVDRIAVRVNVNCDIIDPESYRPNLEVAQYPQNMSMESTPIIHEVCKETNYAQLLIANLQMLDHNLEEYHPPYMCDYYYAEQAYLGTILFFRDKDATPISPKTIATIESLRSFIIFVLTDLITRQYYAKPGKATFLNNVFRSTRELDLKVEDAKVFVLRLCGVSYDEISKRLGISINVAKKCAARVTHRGGAQTLMEIFSRRFMPWLEEPGDEFWDDVRAAIQERQVMDISRRKVKRMERRDRRRKR